jgi:hypothetical protein
LTSWSIQSNIHSLVTFRQHFSRYELKDCVGAGRVELKSGRDLRLEKWFDQGHNSVNQRSTIVDVNLLCSNWMTLLRVSKVEPKGSEVDLEKMPNGDVLHVKDRNLKWIEFDLCFQLNASLFAFDVMSIKFDRKLANS